MLELFKSKTTPPRYMLELFTDELANIRNWTISSSVWKPTTEKEKGENRNPKIDAATTQWQKTLQYIYRMTARLVDLLNCIILYTTTHFICEKKKGKVALW